MSTLLLCIHAQVDASCEAMISSKGLSSTVPRASMSKTRRPTPRRFVVRKHPPKQPRIKPLALHHTPGRTRLFAGKGGGCALLIVAIAAASLLLLLIQ